MNTVSLSLLCWCYFRGSWRWSIRLSPLLKNNDYCFYQYCVNLSLLYIYLFLQNDQNFSPCFSPSLYSRLQNGRSATHPFRQRLMQFRTWERVCRISCEISGPLRKSWRRRWGGPRRWLKVCQKRNWRPQPLFAMCMREV